MTPGLLGGSETAIPVKISGLKFAFKGPTGQPINEERKKDHQKDGKTYGR